MKRFLSLFFAVLMAVTFVRAEELTPVAATPLQVGENDVAINDPDWDYEVDDYQHYTSLYKYTAQDDCYVTIYAEGNNDTFGTLFDNNLEYITWSDDDHGSDFLFTFNAKAGDVFYIGAGNFDDMDIDSYKIVVEEKTTAVATIGDKKYYDFMNALDDISDNETLTLLADIEYPDGDNHEYIMNAITLNLNGHTIRGRIYNDSYLSIDDTSKEQSGGARTSSDNYLLKNNGEYCVLTIHGGTFVGGAITSNNGLGEYNINGGTFILPEDSDMGYTMCESDGVVFGEGIVYRDIRGEHDDIYSVTEEIRYSGTFVDARTPSSYGGQSLNGHKYVDLGLSSGTLWAACNVGASLPYMRGDHYAWGEVETHYSAGGDSNEAQWKDDYSEGYTWSTYKWMDHNINFYSGCTKYTVDDGQRDCIWYSNGEFIGDGISELEDADDVATQTWGGSWKIPTYEQQTELRKECYWVWTSTYKNKDVNGYIVYKAKNDEDKGVKVCMWETPSSDYDVDVDAHIFLPATGYRSGTTLNDIGGQYMSRSISETDSDLSLVMTFLPEEVTDGSVNNRCFGFAVRPVLSPIAEITSNGKTTTISNLPDYKREIHNLEGSASIKLLSDITLEEENNFYFGNKGNIDITFDLNGHKLIGSNAESTIIDWEDGNLTIIGEGTVENNGEFGFAISSFARLVINGGTYKGTEGICFIEAGRELIINDGKFDAPILYYTYEDIFTKPIVKGGIFSMDPSDCVAEGYEAVENDDEETKDVYEYKVVKKSATAIKDIEAKKAHKAVKTIENGKVVIIRDGEKFDLSGARVK